MRKIRKGDIVSRNSYENDIMFAVKRILKLSNQKEIAILKGINVRVEADAPIEDLKIASKDEIRIREKEFEKNILLKIKNERKGKENRRKEVVYTGRILHLDGDKSFVYTSQTKLNTGL